VVVFFRAAVFLAAGFLRVVVFFRAAVFLAAGFLRAAVFLAAGFLRAVVFFRVVAFLRVALLALLLLAGIAITFLIEGFSPIHTIEARSPEMGARHNFVRPPVRVAVYCSRWNLWASRSAGRRGHAHGLVGEALQDSWRSSFGGLLRG
jgi:hypothetical protein